MPQFNPLNEKLKKEYEEALLHGRHREARTVDAVWKAINQFENFTGRQPFTAFSTEQAKGFKNCLTKQTNSKGEPHSLSTIKSTLNNVREFLSWLNIHPATKRHMNGRAIEFLHLSNNDQRAARATKPRITPTVIQIVQTVAAMPHDTDIEKRDRALLAFVAITGVRDGALISLRLKDVDIPTRTIWQDPKHVKTKFRKSMTTAFVPIDPMLEVIVLEWLEYAKNALKLPDNAPLFPSTRVAQNPDNLAFEVQGVGAEPWQNASAVRHIFKTAFARVGLPYFHPHTCRHMLAVWAMEHGGQLEAKAISQNLGHEHMMTTYNSYGCI
ncbi:MAG: site-specific integrase, partial [Alphaproteobacteria bacterium]